MSNDPKVGPVLQGQLFDSDALEKSNRVALGKSRFPSGSKKQTIRDDLRDTVMQISRIPTSDLQPRPEIHKSRFTGEMVPREETRLITGAGHYQPERRKTAASAPNSEGVRTREAYLERDDVAVPNNGYENRSTMVHELGHRNHIGKTGGAAPKGKDQAADPLYEGHADAYVDRYLPQSSQAVEQKRYPNHMERMYTEHGDHPFDPKHDRGYKRMENTGYSTNFKGDSRRGQSWNATDRALYAATRAHAGATGETINYPNTQYAGAEKSRRPDWEKGNDPRPSAATDAALHGLVTTSTPAREAVDATTWQHKSKTVSMGEVADAAVRRHKDRTLLSQGQFVQEDLFGDKTAWRNQQGEQPRTLKDVSGTLSLQDHVLESPPGARVRRGLL